MRCLTLVLGLLMVWATAFFAGLAYLQAWETAGAGNTIFNFALLPQELTTVHRPQNPHPQQERDAGERYRVKLTDQEKQDVQRDGYLITSDSPLIRERVRSMCACNVSGVGWQRAYASLHRNTLAFRRRVNALVQRHKEAMDQKVKGPLTPQNIPRMGNNDDLRQVYGDHSGESEGGVIQEQMSLRGEKYLVYSCLLGQHCGGWGDRMNGVMNAFFVALLTDRTLLIDWELPPPIEADQEPLPSGGGESEPRSMSSSELADAALRTYVEMVNGVKQELQQADSEGGSEQNKRRRLTIARLLEPTNIDWRFSKQDLVPMLNNKDTAYVDTVDMVLNFTV
jgi:hypothetical protein